MNSPSDKKPIKRTGQQNRALHLWLTMLANELNEAGLSAQLVLKEKMELIWTPAMCKELLWRPAQRALFKKKSTTQLNKQQEIDLIYNHLARHLGEKFGLEVPDFPTHELGYWEKAPIKEKE